MTTCSRFCKEFRTSSAETLAVFLAINTLAKQAENAEVKVFERDDDPHNGFAELPYSDPVWQEGWAQLVDFVLASYDVPRSVAGLQDSVSYAAELLRLLDRFFPDRIDEDTVRLFDELGANDLAVAALLKGTEFLKQTEGKPTRR